jgi:hypothetical protein
VAISREQLRDVAQLALRQRGYDTQSRTAPGVAPGARLTAVKGTTKLKIAVRTSQRRELGLVPGPEGKWKAPPSIDWMILAVPSKTAGYVEVLCFDASTLIKEFNLIVRKHQLTVEADVPVFVALDEERSKGSTARAGGLKAIALWNAQFEAKDLGRKSRAKQLDQFIARVTGEFADLVGVGPERVIVDFRISSEAKKSD